MTSIPFKKICSRYCLALYFCIALIPIAANATKRGTDAIDIDKTTLKRFKWIPMIPVDVGGTIIMQRGIETIKEQNSPPIHHTSPSTAGQLVSHSCSTAQHQNPLNLCALMDTDFLCAPRGSKNNALNLTHANLLALNYLCPNKFDQSQYIEDWTYVVCDASGSLNDVFTDRNGPFGENLILIQTWSSIQPMSLQP